MSVKRYELRYAHAEGHTDLCYTEDGKQMITCGSDGDIRLWSGIEDNDPESFCVGQGAFSVAQKGDSIYICRDDGRVIILKYPEGERDGILTRFTAPATHITVTRNKALIACGSEDFSVKIFDAPSDVDSTTFTDMQGPALSIAISPDECYVAASCGDTKIYIWDTKTKALVNTINAVPACNSFTSAKVLCRISFDPKSKYLAYPKGKEIVVTNVPQFEQLYTLSTENVVAVYTICQFSPCGNYIAASSILGDICIWRATPGSEPVISTHDAKYNVCALAWNPEGENEIAFCDTNGQIGTLEYYPSVDSSIPVEMQNDDHLTIHDLDDDDADNENAVSLELLKNETLGLLPPSSDAGSYGLNSRPQSPERPRSPPCTLQPPFQPSSTPSHLNQRFLVYNDVGIIRLHEEEDAESSLDVYFHDATLHKNIYMKNHLNHSMASLSKTVMALACEAPSKLVCIPLKPGTKEWSTDLSDLEEVLCISASCKLVVMATNTRMLRVFSIFGSQRTVISIPGPVVSIATLNHFIFVIYHACTAHSKDQNLSGMLVQVNGEDINSKIMPLPITPQSTLTWIGFTDAGSLASYDSAGILRISRINSGTWIPACDTTIHAKGASDSYFVTYVCESSQTLRVIHCKGKVYPHATPLPVLLELPMQMPMCEIETDKSQLEDNLFRISHFETAGPEKLYKETAIKLFALALRSDLEDRAYELLEVFNSVQLSNIAMKYANKMGRSRLVERISELLRKMQGEDEDENVIIDENTNPIVPIRPMIRKKPRIEPMKQLEPLTESQPIYSPVTEIVANDSIFSKEDSQNENDSTPRPRVRNPFIKAASTGEPKPNLLNFLDQAACRPEIDKKKSKQSERPTVEPITELDFKTWYSSMKPELIKEHPEMEKAALIRHALQMYKKRKAPEEISQPKSKQSKLSAFAFTK